MASKLKLAGKRVMRGSKESKERRLSRDSKDSVSSKAGQAATPTPSPAADDIERVFRQFDEDGSGDIDVGELTTALNALGVRSDGSQAAAVMAEFRSANSAGLQLPEFTKLVTELSQFQAASEKQRADIEAAKNNHTNQNRPSKEEMLDAQAKTAAAMERLGEFQAALKPSVFTDAAALQPLIMQCARGGVRLEQLKGAVEGARLQPEARTEVLALVCESVEQVNVARRERAEDQLDHAISQDFGNEFVWFEGMINRACEAGADARLVDRAYAHLAKREEAAARELLGKTTNSSFTSFDPMPILSLLSSQEEREVTTQTRISRRRSRIRLPIAQPNLAPYPPSLLSSLPTILHP